MRGDGFGVRIWQSTAWSQHLSNVNVAVAITIHQATATALTSSSNTLIFCARSSLQRALGWY